MKKQIFVINGVGGTGKDTFVSMVAEASDRTIINYSSIDKVKEIAKAIGWKGGKTEKDRKFLYDLKMLCTNYCNMPFNDVNERVKAFIKSDAPVMFIHIREPEEIKKAEAAFGAKTILVRRDSVGQISSNAADRDVLNYCYDIVINNNKDIDTLRQKALAFTEDFYNGTLKCVY